MEGELLCDAGVQHGLFELLLLLFDLFHQLFLLRQLQLPVLADGLVVLLAIILDYHALVLLILSQLLPNFLSLLLLPLLDLPHSFLPGPDLLLLGDVLALGERVGLEKIELVAGGHEGELVERVDGLGLAGLQLGQLVEGPPGLLYLGLKGRKVLKLDLEVEGLGGSGTGLFHFEKKNIMLWVKLE